VNSDSPGWSKTIVLRTTSPAFAPTRKPKAGTMTPCSVSALLLSRMNVTARPTVTPTFAGTYLNSVEMIRTSAGGGVEISSANASVADNIPVAAAMSAILKVGGGWQPLVPPKTEQLPAGAGRFVRTNIL